MFDNFEVIVHGLEVIHHLHNLRFLLADFLLHVGHFLFLLFQHGAIHHASSGTELQVVVQLTLISQVLGLELLEIGMDLSEVRNNIQYLGFGTVKLIL
jgi:hypothetical protein